MWRSESKGVLVGNTPVDPEKHHHDLPRLSEFQEGDIWQCLTCLQMYRKEWRDFCWDTDNNTYYEADWYWMDYTKPIEKGTA